MREHTQICSYTVAEARLVVRPRRRPESCAATSCVLVALKAECGAAPARLFTVRFIRL